MLLLLLLFIAYRHDSSFIYGSVILLPDRHIQPACMYWLLHWMKVK